MQESFVLGRVEGLPGWNLGHAPILDPKPGLSQNGIDGRDASVKQIERMQLIRAVPCDVERYAQEGFQRRLRPPPHCPHCGSMRALWALGYYARNISRLHLGFLRILIRRFRCRFCRKTVSILPSFAQPYRLIQNSTIERFVRGGPWSNDVIRLLPLLQLYWKRFATWLPEVRCTVSGGLPRPPPAGEPLEWWTSLLSSYDGLGGATLTFVSTFQITLFGRYRCHRPNPPQGRDVSF